jgi:hypothetical protein
MSTLRWILGGLALFFGGGFLVLCIVASGFRKSFGASELNPLLVVLPLAALAILLAGLLFPSSKPLLHTGALAAVGLIGFCVWQMIVDFATVLIFGIAYLVAWLAFYWMAAFRT